MTEDLIDDLESLVDVFDGRHGVRGAHLIEQRILALRRRNGFVCLAVSLIRSNAM